MGKIIKIPFVESKKGEWELTDPYGSLKDVLKSATKIGVMKCRKSESK